MVDFHTYKQLHPNKHTYYKIHDYLDPAATASDEPPPAPSIYVFPNKIPGYNLRSKKWGKYIIGGIGHIKYEKVYESYKHGKVD